MTLKFTWQILGWLKRRSLSLPFWAITCFLLNVLMMRIRPRLSAIHKCRTRTWPTLSLSLSLSLFRLWHRILRNMRFLFPPLSWRCCCCRRLCCAPGVVKVTKLTHGGRTDIHSTAQVAAIDANKGRRTWPRERIPPWLLILFAPIQPRARLQFDCLNFVGLRPKVLYSYLYV